MQFALLTDRGFRFALAHFLVSSLTLPLPFLRSFGREWNGSRWGARRGPEGSRWGPEGVQMGSRWGPKGGPD